jgi:dynein heavy chain, axonemal
MFQIKLEANYTKDDWYNDIKSMLITAGVDQKEVVFHLKHNEIIKEDFLDDINTLVNNGEIQGIFTKEEYENIISQT